MSSMSPITTLFEAACALVAASEANSSHGKVRVAMFFVISLPCFVSVLEKAAAN
jgi:ABC-type spermidine/putrescine transport system permease subunit I